MKISIGCDHRGFDLKLNILAQFSSIEVNGVKHEISWHDVGAFSPERSDYPLFARPACKDIIEQRSEFGILICGSGVGMAIAANRFPGIYAALCWSVDVAYSARADDNMNVLVLSADLLTAMANLAIVQTTLHAWATPTFKGGHYQERLAMIDRD